MQNRVNKTIAAAALLGLAATAGAQTPTRRIPVTKDRQPVDTVVRTDTVTRYRTDTLTVYGFDARVATSYLDRKYASPGPTPAGS